MPDIQESGKSTIRHIPTVNTTYNTTMIAYITSVNNRHCYYKQQRQIFEKFIDDDHTILRGSLRISRRWAFVTVYARYSGTAADK